MKNVAFALVLLSVWGLTGCGQTSQEPVHDPAQASKTVMTKVGPEFTSAYICPMHCEGSGSDKQGKCPVCDMDYRPNEDNKTAGPDSTQQ